jgi:hypothetical protein
VEDINVRRVYLGEQFRTLKHDATATSGDFPVANDERGTG